jgi:flagellar hook-associated protein 2
MTITVAGNAFVVETGGKTLAGVRDAINDATTNTGVTASILNDDAGYRLVLSSNGTGSAQALSVSYSAADPFTLATLNTDRDASGGFTTADLDARLTLEGQFSVTSSSNSISDVIEGVTLSLKKAGSLTLTVDRDSAAVQSSVNNFVKSYSDLVKTIGNLRTKGLRSESTALLDIESQFRSVLNTSVDVEGGFNLAFELGISTQKDGTLTVNSTTLSNALSSDFNGVANLFADPDKGVAVRLSAIADEMLSASGIVAGRSQSLERQVRGVDDQREALQRRLALVEERYFRQFRALDSLTIKLQSTSTFLTQQLSLFSRSSSDGR